MKVFIIGGTGLLGSEGTRELLTRGHQVTTLARRVPSKGGSMIVEGVSLLIALSRAA